MFQQADVGKVLFSGESQILVPMGKQSSKPEKLQSFDRLVIHRLPP
jgi:hypothetical protein